MTTLHDQVMSDIKAKRQGLIRTYDVGQHVLFMGHGDKEWEVVIVGFRKSIFDNDWVYKISLSDTPFEGHSYEIGQEALRPIPYTKHEMKRKLRLV